MSISKNEIKLIRSLQQKKNRMQEGLFVVEGKKAVEEALRMKQRVTKVFTTEEDFSLNHQVPLIHARDMEQISSLTQPPGFLAVVKQETVPLSELSGVTFCIANAIADPGNLGTLMRTCEWFGVNAFILDDNCVDVFNSKVVQATMGSILRMPIVCSTAEEIIHFFMLKGIDLLAADLDGTPIQTFKAPDQWALVVGSESHGVSDAFVRASKTRLNIPSQGNAESLNASVAGGIAIYHLKVNA